MSGRAGCRGRLAATRCACPVRRSHCQADTRAPVIGHSRDRLAGCGLPWLWRPPEVPEVTVSSRSRRGTPRPPAAGHIQSQSAFSHSHSPRPVSSPHQIQTRLQSVIVQSVTVTVQFLFQANSISSPNQSTSNPNHYQPSVSRSPPPASIPSQSQSTSSRRPQSPCATRGDRLTRGLTSTLTGRDLAPGVTDCDLP